MTTEQPLDQPHQQPPSAHDPTISGGARPMAIRTLRRRHSDRVIGGVAAGLGDYLNVDPILLRAGFAGLMIFGGAGLVLYVLGWLLIPEQGQTRSMVEAAIHGFSQRTGRLGTAVVVLLLVGIASPFATSYGGSFYIDPAIYWPLAIAGVGILLLLPHGQARDSVPTTSFGDPADAGVASIAATGPSPAWAGGPGMAAAAQPVAGAWSPAAMAPPRVREQSPLGWFVLAGLLVAVGALAIADTVASVRVLPGQYFGAGLLALGAGLVVGAWWGRARLLILLGLVIVPLAVVSAFLTVPLEGGVGAHEYQPRNIGEVQPAYHLAGGRLTLDLSGLGAGSEPVRLDASVGVGDLLVIVPRNATVEVTSSVQGGELWLLGRDHIGTALNDHVAEAGSPAGATLILTLDAGLGQVWVERSTVEDN